MLMLSGGCHNVGSVDLCAREVAEMKEKDDNGKEKMAGLKRENMSSGGRLHVYEAAGNNQ